MKNASTFQNQRFQEIAGTPGFEHFCYDYRNSQEARKAGPFVVLFYKDRQLCAERLGLRRVLRKIGGE